MHYEDLIKDYAPRWPYPVNYGKENAVSCDVLILGGGIAGCWAAIGAARKGAKVVLVEKGATKTSGAGGAGVDHWQCAVTNPACTISPEEFTQAIIDNYGGYRSGITTYIKCRESYDCLLDMEKMGVKVRDSEDEFKGAEFRDEKTKLLFAYDYNAKYTVRVWGANAKSALYRECKSLGVTILDRIMVTSLLTEGGRPGSRVVGATGVNSQTGEFYIFSGKAIVLCMSLARREYLFSTELKGMSSGLGPGNASGDGHAMAWKAGAEFVGGEQSRRGSYSPFGYPMYGVGNAGNTWFACSMVDAHGKEIPWVDRDGRLLTTVSERYRPAPGQKFFLDGGGLKGYVTLYEYAGPQLMPTLGFNANPHNAGTGKATAVALPMYSDLPSMPQHERRAIWGLMVGQEGKTLIPIYRTYGQAGFDPDQDLLEAHEGGWFGVVPQQWRDASGGGLVVDWDLMTSLDGLFAAGQQVFVSGCHANAAVTGRYAGRHAAQYAAKVGKIGIDRSQVEKEKTRVYAPVTRKHGMEWKELNAGACRIMQDYCGELKSEELLTIGLKWFEELETGEASTVFARNPHELARVLEVLNIISTGRMMMEACRARKASIAALGFRRVDYPEMDPPEWRKWVTIRLDGGTVKTGELPLDYHGDFETNYNTRCGL